MHTGAARWGAGALFRLPEGPGTDRPNRPLAGGGAVLCPVRRTPGTGAGKPGDSPGQPDRGGPRGTEPAPKPGDRRDGIFPDAFGVCRGRGLRQPGL